MKVSYIELLGKKHPLCFSVKAASEMEEAFGGIEAFAEHLQEGSLVQKIQNMSTALQILMKAGRAYVSVSGGELPDPLPCDLEDLIDAADKTIWQTIMDVISGSTEREVETVVKNGEATQGLPELRGSTTAEPRPD